MIENGDHVVAGVSGGADSVCLLRVLCELRECMGFSLSAVHVEHGIRGAESLSDAAFVRELCAALEVPLLSFSVDVRAGPVHLASVSGGGSRDRGMKAFMRHAGSWGKSSGGGPSRR